MTEETQGSLILPKLQLPESLGSRFSPYEMIQDKVFKTDMFFVSALVNGEMARDLVAAFNREPEAGKQATNRKASKIKIQQYADQMLAGEWFLNPQPIVFSEPNADNEYEQEDGQQRLKAVILASLTVPDIEIPFVFCIDAPLAAKMVIDQGKPRLPSDWLRMMGEVNASPLSHALKLLYCYLEVPYESLDSWRKVRFSNQQQALFLREHPGLRQGLTIARDSRMLLQQYIGAVTWYLAAQEYDPFVASEFMNGLEKGVNLTEHDARWRFREFLARRKYQHHKWDGYEQFALTIKAFNAWMVKNPDFKPIFRRSDRFPKIISKQDVPTIFTD